MASQLNFLDRLGGIHKSSGRGHYLYQQLASRPVDRQYTDNRDRGVVGGKRGSAACGYRPDGLVLRRDPRS